MCYIQNKDFKATLKSVEEAESFIKAVIVVSAIKFKSYIFYFLELLFLLLRICYLFFLGGGGIFFKDNFLLHCSMFTSIKDDFKGILWSKKNYNVLGDVYLEINPKSNQSDSAVNDFYSRIVIARDISLV